MTDAPRNQSATRTYATTSGFYIGDRVEAHVPHDDAPTKGWVRDIDPNRCPVIELDDSRILTLPDVHLTRIED